MSFAVKQWLNKRASGTVLDAPDATSETNFATWDAAAARDLETRLSGYADAGDTALSGRVGVLEAGDAWVTTPEAHGAAGDGRVLMDAAITVSQSVLTSASGPFVSADVGKTVMIRGAGLNTQGNTMVSTIASYQSATQVTLAGTAAVSVTAAVAIYGTDDTAAFKTAIAALVATAVSRGVAAGLLKLGARIYMIAGAPTLGGATAGNAQIPLPNITQANSKFSLRIQGPTDTSYLYHWVQTAPMVGGATLVSTLLGQTSDATYGLPSVIGGPTSLAADSSGAFGFSNVLVSIDGLGIVMPRNPSYVGVDLFRCAQANIGTLSIVADATAVAGAPAGTAIQNSATNTNGLGLRMPALTNNDNTNVFSYGCEGLFYGLAISDHFTAQRLATIYCDTGLFAGSMGSSPQHGSFIGYWSAEACNTGMEIIGNAGGKFPMFVARMDCEVTGGGVTVKDTNSVIYGELHYAHNTSNPPTRSGATNLRIVDDNRARGAFTAPAVPASTVAVADAAMPWRDAQVIITGGTVTAIVVDGQTMFTSTAADRVVLVPTGKTISITYSVAPTWKWMLL